MLSALFFVFVVSISAQVGQYTTEITESISTTLFAGDDSDLVFALTVSGRLFRSKDGGQVWNDEGNKLEGLNATSGIAQILPHPADPTGQHVLLLAGEGEVSYFTTNGGDTWTMHDQTDNFVEGVLFSPVDPSVFVMVSFHPNCYSFGDVDPPCHDRAFLTRNFGRDFVQIASFVHTIRFAPAKFNENGVALVMTTYNKRDEPQRDLDPTEQTLFVVDEVKGDDGVAAMESGLWAHKRLDDSFGVVWLDKFMFAVSRDTQDDGPRAPMLLWASADGGQTFRVARFPVFLSTFSQITILNTADVMVMSLWLEQSDDHGTLFLSDGDGLEYIESLKYLRRYFRHRYDMYFPQGLPGIYYANQVLVPTTRFRTVISTDGGGLWSLLARPELRADGTPYTCTQSVDLSDGEGCSMHLFLERGPITPTTSDRAVGVMLAHGTVGTSLASSRSELQPFLSRDSGITWKHTIGESNSVFTARIGFHGSILVLGQQSTYVTSVDYTLTEGQSWVALPENAFTELMIQDIVHHRSLTTEEFLIQGRTRSGSGVLVLLDFAELDLPTCRGLDTPGEDGSDYEFYSPSTTAPGCVLGRKVQFVRRRATRPCVDMVEVERKIVAEPCDCTRDDFECDFGYQVTLARTCRRNAKVSDDVLTPFAQCSLPGADSYFVTKGFRKEPGNECIDLEGLDRQRVSCSGVTAPPTLRSTSTTSRPSTTSVTSTSTTTSTRSGVSTTTTKQRVIGTGTPTSQRTAQMTSEPDTGSAPSSVDVDVASPGPSAGTIFLIVAAVLLTLIALYVVAVIIRKKRTSYEKHGAGGNTPVDADDMELSSESL